MRIAAIDVGTNSIHMIVCLVRPDLSFEVIDREKDMIRLGAGGLDGRRLAEPSVTAAIQTLGRFHRLAVSHGVDEIVATATSAVREARNGADFVAAVRRQVGIRVRVISGQEEARLIHQAAAYAVDVGRRAAVVIDIGGGSTEITLGTAARMQIGRSFKLGVIRLTERFARTDPLSERDVRRIVRHVRRETGAYVKQIRQRGFHRVVGTSGTILSLGALAAEGGLPDDVRSVRVGLKALQRVRDRLVGLTLEQRLKIPALEPRRADLAPAGAILLDTLLGLLGASELTLCDFALREGLILDYIQRNPAHIRTVERYPDVRRRSVIELAERCNYWPAHAQQVARLALALFDGTRHLHGLGPREREWLEYAALLHDIGVHISYERHNRHSYYLIRHGGLRGFDPEEIEVIGLVARYHRQGAPKKGHEGFRDLPRERRATVRVLAGLVRLAEGLDRSHSQVISGVTVNADDEGLSVSLDANAEADLESWAAERHAAPLAKALGTPIHFEVVPRTGAASPNQPAARRRRTARPTVRRREARGAP
jgi:exopolyphosphatase / guanosine-5'-triphosphate,3'-diphosphate pyrophosphatase